MKVRRFFLSPMRRLANNSSLLATTMVGIWLACSAAYAFTEHKGFAESLWWGVITGSTVGYGDAYPVTIAGRVVAVVLITSMVILVPLAISHVIAGLMEEDGQAERDALAARFDRLERAVLASLEERHGRQWVDENTKAPSRRAS
jgi:uncharacterized PurR-regulated membrane protein YhhQ (DUF165 family)